MCRYRLVDLFAGCGGMTRGFVDTGRFEPVFAVEKDPYAAATYAANFGDDHVIAAPIEEVETFPSADVVIGGPPCQGFSPLNRDGVGLERRALWREYLGTSRERPQAFVMENVPSCSIRGVRSLQAPRRRLGYRVEGESSTRPTTACRSAAGGRS